MRRRWQIRLAALLVATGLAVACSPATEDAAGGPAASSLAPPPGRNLVPLVPPDFSKMEAPARGQMQARFSELESKIAAAGTPPAELAAAYGELGVLLMAATFLDAAESCFLNAQTLAPGDRRWPYYLGQVYRMKGPLEAAVTAFSRALELSPDDVATLVWLGEVHLAQDRTAEAGPLFAKALALEPGSVAARYGAGRTALAVRDYARAVEDLEAALAGDPRATSVHYPLAMAYRGLGNVSKAQEHLEKQGDLEPRPADPLMSRMDSLLESAEAFNVRGGEALDAGNWAGAAEYFRQGLEVAPADASLRHRLGTALYQMGDVAGAQREFEQVIRSSPGHARAHFSLGLLSHAAGRHAEAIDRFSAAIEHEPGYVQARVQLANALARSGRGDEALAEFNRALEMDPTLSDAAFGRAMLLVKLGRYAEARDRLADTARAQANPVFSHALARLLAAAPDARVRDGRRALALVDELLKGQQSIELVETTAMALAEVGRFEEAAAAQRDALAAAQGAGLTGIARRLTANLKLYESRRACRTPFTDAELNEIW